MPGPTAPPPGVGYRIKVGQIIAGNIFSNTALTILGQFRVIYDDGTPDIFKVLDQASGSSRAQVVWLTDHKATQNGWVVGGGLTYGGSAFIQRGQAYAYGVIANPSNLADYTDILFAAYLWVPIALGQIEPAGPAGGNGAMTRVLTADPAAGSDIAVQSVPTGAVWLVHTASVQLVQGITQTPLPTLRIRTASTAAIMAQIPITTTAIGASSTAQLTWGLGLVQSSFTAVVGDEFHMAPLPNVYLTGGQANSDDIATVTDGIGANTNYGAMEILVEEWVVPN